MRKTRGMQLVVVFWLLSLALGLVACQAPGASFPLLTGEQGPLPVPTDPPILPAEPGPWDSPVRLRLAVPFGKEAAESLRLLFLAKEAGASLEGPASQLTREDLMAYDAPLELDVVTVSARDGALSDQLALWLAANEGPDLIYTRQAATVPGINQLAECQTVLADLPHLNQQHVFPAGLDAIRENLALYGLPYLSSVPLQCYNLDLLSQVGKVAPEMDPNWDSWQAWALGVQAALLEAGLQVAPDPDGLIEAEIRQTQLRQAVFVHDSLAGLAPLRLLADGQANGCLWTGEAGDRGDQGMNQALLWLRQLAQMDLDASRFSPDDRALVFEQADPGRPDRHLASWLIDSTDLAYWHQQDGLTVSAGLVPMASSQAARDNTPMRVPLHTRCLVVSRLAPDVDGAIRLAAFLALDPDALIMLSRYQVFEGLYPMVNDPAVWQALVERQRYGGFMAAYRDRFYQAVVSGSHRIENWDHVQNESCQQALTRFLAAEASADLDALLQAIQVQAAGLPGIGGEG